MARGRPGPALTFGIPLILLGAAGFLVWKFVLKKDNGAQVAGGGGSGKTGGGGGGGGGTTPGPGSATDLFPADPKAKTVITMTGDPWSGYSTFRGEPKLAAELIKNGIALHYLSDEKYYDQDARMADLAAGKLDMAVTTVDAFLQHGAKHKNGGKYPGVILWNIDESNGGDAIFVAKGKKNFDDVTDADTVCYSTGTPSEHLWDFASLSFSHLENLKTDNGVVAADCWAKLKEGKVQVAVLWQPFTAIAEKEGYRKVFATGAQADDIIVDIMVANPDWLAKNQKAADTLAKSYFKVIDEYQKDTAAHEKFITDDCGPDCNGDVTLGKSVLSGIDFLDAEENMKLWYGFRDGAGAKPKMEARIEKTGKLLASKKKIDVADLPMPNTIIDTSLLKSYDMKRDVTGEQPVAVQDKNDAATIKRNTKAKDDRSTDVGTLKLPTIYFPDGSAKLDQNGKSIVAEIATKLESFPGLCVRIYGYTSSSGDKGFNVKLSKDRANAIAQTLRDVDAKSFNDARLDVRGFGPANLVMKNGAEDADASRRTEFTLYNCAEQ